MDNNIPETLLIADVKTKIEQIVNHPVLSPVIIEVILKEAYLRTTLRAQEQLELDLKQYKERQDRQKHESEVNS